MKIYPGLALCTFILFAALSCNTGLIKSSQIAPTATPINLTRSDPAQLYKPMTKACTLVTRQDVGGFFSAEVYQPLYASNHSNQVIFPAPPVSANEYYCAYMAFHNPGSKNGAYYQVTYWVDMPDKASPSEWSQLWADGKSHATQMISGIGDDAFYVNERLTFKKGNTYVTVEVLSTAFDAKTAAGVTQQIDIEKKVALTALNRMTN